MHAVLHSIQPETSNISTFWFHPDKPMRYTAGQFTEIRLPHDHADERGDKRWFTLSSSPTDELVSITTRLDPKRPSSFKQTLFGLRPGTSVNLAEPMGDFVLPLDKQRPLVFVAAGMGVTPMHSMVKWLVDHGETRPIHMLYAVTHQDDAVFRPLFEQAPITFELLETSTAGKLTTKRIATLPHAQDNSLVYLSGPEVMVEQFVAELPALGVPKKRLVTDYFPGYKVV